MAAGFGLERLRQPDDSRYFYPFAVAFTWAALSGVAADFHEPYARWLKSVAPWTRGQVEYLFIGNAAHLLRSRPHLRAFCIRRRCARSEKRSDS
jgi:hypothetical protein